MTEPTFSHNPSHNGDLGRAPTLSRSVAFNQFDGQLPAYLKELSQQYTPESLAPIIDGWAELLPLVIPIRYSDPSKAALVQINEGDKIIGWGELVYGETLMHRDAVGPGDAIEGREGAPNDFKFVGCETAEINNKEPFKGARLLLFAVSERPLDNEFDLITEHATRYIREQMQSSGFVSWSGTRNLHTVRIGEIFFQTLVWPLSIPT